MNSKTSTPSPDHSDAIKVNDLQHGDCVSTDQYECRVKGRLHNTRVREDPQKMYCGGIIFVDHAPSKVDVLHQVSLGSVYTVQFKELYEQEATEYSVSIKSYRGDNGVFKTQYFKDDTRKQKQLITLSGVVTHDQNGVAE